MAKERGHYILDKALIKKAARLAALGWSQRAIAQACNVAEETFCRWLKAGRLESGTDLERQLCQSIQEALTAGEENLVAKIRDGDTRDAQWLLTHSARWRDRWSDAAATRREVNNVLTNVVQIIQQSELTQEQRDHLLLQMHAAGLGAVS